MEKAKVVKLYNINRLKGNFVSVIHKHSDYLQALCNKIGLELITLSRFYSQKTSIFDYKYNNKIEPDIFETYLEYKNSPYIRELPPFFLREEVITKYKNILQDYGFIKGDKLTKKAYLLLRILKNDKNGINEFGIEDLL